jgi:NAD(P)-dependent dehydrogenase (short-subunit alcohol dehydrogenase family)
MINNGRGLIVNVVTRWVHEATFKHETAGAGIGSYAASKCGVVGLTHALQTGLEIELLDKGPISPGIRAFTWEPPGTFDSEMR